MRGRIHARGVEGWFRFQKRKYPDDGAKPGAVCADTVCKSDCRPLCKFWTRQRVCRSAGIFVAGGLAMASKGKLDDEDVVSRRSCADSKTGAAS